MAWCTAAILMADKTTHITHQLQQSVSCHSLTFSRVEVMLLQLYRCFKCKAVLQVCNLTLLHLITLFLLCLVLLVNCPISLYFTLLLCVFSSLFFSKVSYFSFTHAYFHVRQKGSCEALREAVMPKETLNQSIYESIYISCLWNSSGESTDNSWEHSESATIDLLSHVMARPVPCDGSTCVM